jgi:hypothetical protein
LLNWKERAGNILHTTSNSMVAVARNVPEFLWEFLRMLWRWWRVVREIPFDFSQPWEQRSSIGTLDLTRFVNLLFCAICAFNIVWTLSALSKSCNGLCFVSVVWGWEKRMVRPICCCCSRESD